MKDIELHEIKMRTGEITDVSASQLDNTVLAHEISSASTLLRPDNDSLSYRTEASQLKNFRQFGYKQTLKMRMDENIVEWPPPAHVWWEASAAMQWWRWAATVVWCTSVKYETELVSLDWVPRSYEMWDVRFKAKIVWASKVDAMRGKARPSLLPETRWAKKRWWLRFERAENYVCYKDI